MMFATAATNTLFQIVRSCRQQSLKMVSVRCQSTAYPTTSDGLSIEPKDQVLWIKFNRPKKFNAITRPMYEDLGNTFKKVNQDNEIKAIVLTGNGDYYSSGNDLSNFTVALADEGGPRAGLTKSRDILEYFVASLINLEKLLIAAVNGPAVGIPVTTLPLCDYVIASDKATFQTPFTALGQCPEACSSLTFPAILGRTRASELLLLNMAWDAKKAKQCGLVSEVVEHAKFESFLSNLTKMIVTSCYPNSMMVSKSVIQSPATKQRMLEANKLECDKILECWCGEECSDAVQKFFQRSRK